MEFYYDYGLTGSDLQEVQRMLPIVLGALLIVWLILLVFAVLSYVLTALGYQTVAKRRGIRNPWLAWIPVANTWLLGCISDQYQYVVKGKITNRRKILLGLNIGSICVGIVMSIIANILTMVSSDGVAAASVISILSVLLSWGMIITATVFAYIALYDYYCSCVPQNSVLFLVLGIFFSFLQPFFIFFSRKKDGGMPPRRSAQPAQPAQPTADSLTPPAAPAAEPWEAPQEADPWNSDNQA